MQSVQRELEARTLTVYKQLWSAHIDARILGNDDRQWHHAIAELRCDS
jgi:hypothetical protein